MEVEAGKESEAGTKIDSEAGEESEAGTEIDSEAGAEEEEEEEEGERLENPKRRSRTRHCHLLRPSGVWVHVLRHHLVALVYAGGLLGTPCPDGLEHHPRDHHSAQCHLLKTGQQLERQVLSIALAVNVVPSTELCVLCEVHNVVRV